MLLAVLATALGVTLCSKWFADRATREATQERLNATGILCVNAAYPLTSSVLTQIQDLSSLKLAIVRETSASSSSGRQFRVEATSSEFPVDLTSDLFGRIVNLTLIKSPSGHFETIEFQSGTLWNAIAKRLPSNSDLENAASPSTRYLVLLERSDRSKGISVQAFVLPLITGLFSSLAIALVATWVASRIGKRIERLENHVQKIAQGSFETITPTGPIDTIHSLYQSVNSMSQQLQRSTSQIAINERSRLVNLIASGLAHELRNHLTGAKLAIQTCESHPHADEAMGIALKQMQLAEESIQRLLTLRVDNSNHITPSLPAIQIMESVQSLTAPMAQHRRIDLAFELVGTDQREKASLQGVSVRDGNTVIGCLINLLLNAMEAAGTGGVVRMTFGATEIDQKVFVQWSVRDNGPGPSKEIASQMFEPFATTKREGVGLGLAMCKRVAEKQDGVVQWRRVDGWTEFLFRVAPDNVLTEEN
jgi:signal transduction histidine kinase